MRYMWLWLVVAICAGCVDPALDAMRRKFPLGTPVKVKGLNITGVIDSYYRTSPPSYCVAYIPQPRGGIFGSPSEGYVYVTEAALERIE